MREEPRIARETLLACAREEYRLSPATIDFLPVGRDLNAGVYRVVLGNGAAYLLKAKSGDFYASGCLVPRYLYDAGVTAVVAPLPARTKELWARAGEWTVVLYPYIEGQTGWAGMSKAHWRLAGGILSRIHEVLVPPSGLEGLRREKFAPAQYVRSLENIETNLMSSERGDRDSEQGLRALWVTHRSTIHGLLASLNKLSGLLRSESRPHVVCHSDFHPGNLLRDRGGSAYVVDWDDVMLAPRERDFIFVGEPKAGSGYGPSFFDGYGPTDIDWIALTYYRYERVVQDLIEDAGQVLFREDLSEQAKAEAAGQFQASLEGRNFDAAQAAAARIPEELRIQRVI